MDIKRKEHIDLNKKPESFNDYKKWYTKKFTADNKNVSLEAIESNYIQAANHVLKKLLDNDSLEPKLNEELNKSSLEYSVSTNNFSLFANKTQMNFVIKPFDSLLNKSYRKNVLSNCDFPNPPKNGWINHDNWFECVNDIIRTEISVRYLDGVDFLIKRLERFSSSQQLNFNFDYEVRDVGYYAVHTYLHIPVEILCFDWSKKTSIMKIEIQISTQLQDVIKKLLHVNYERDRISCSAQDKPWQWDYQSDDFFMNSLGHTLHYLEGLILQVRNKQTATTNREQV